MSDLASTVADPSDPIAPVEPVDTELVRNHCNVISDDEDDLLATYTAAARELVSRDSGLQLVRQRFRHRRFSWPEGRSLELPNPPLVEVESITYLDAAGDSQPWTAGGNWYPDVDRRPGVIWLAPSASWPTVISDRHDAITITYTAGYGPSDSIPEAARQCILLLVANWYRTREAVLVGTISKEIELAYETLIQTLQTKRYL